MITKIAKIVRFDGLVQGVGFRFTANALAPRFNITGYIKNLSDGSVELYAEGSQEDVDSFIEAVREEMNEYIRSIDVQETSPSGRHSRFIVTY